MSREVFKAIPGFEGRYQVSDKGRVKTLNRGKIGTKLMSLVSDGHGYKVVKLGKNRQIFRVHRLVMLAFVGPCPEGLQVDHINGIRDDNRPENLRYVTQKENSQYAVQRRGGGWGCFIANRPPEMEKKRLENMRASLKGVAHRGSAIFTQREAYMIRQAIASGIATRKGLARALGTSKQTIKNIVNRKTLSYL